MRILFVENGIGYGGAIICLRHLVKNLDRSRFVPMVVTGRTGPQYREIADEAEWRHIPDRRIDVVRLREKLHRSSWAGKIAGFRFLLNQILSRLDDIANFLPFFVQFLGLAHRFQPVLIHVNNEPLCNRAAILVGKVLRIPVICHVRGEMKGSVMTNWVYRLPNHFISVSQWISNGIGRVGIPENRRSVVYDGIPLDKLDLTVDGGTFRRRCGIAPDAFAVGLVGLLIPWKGQHLFLDAAKILKEQIPRLKMIIVGGTPDECADYERELKLRTKNEGLDDVVLFTGHISDMPPVYQGLDVVVSASTSPEPLGTVVIESLAMARPLAAPRHGGAAEMCEDQVDALLFVPNEAQSLAESIRRFYLEPGLRTRLGAAARVKALSTFAVDAHVAAVEKIYERILEGDG